MSVSTIVMQSLDWKTLDGASENLFSEVILNFDVYESYVITTQGAFAQSSTKAALGAVIDNLENSAFVNLSLNGYGERVAPFSKSPVRFLKAQNTLKATAPKGIVVVSFFTGFCPGAPYGINPLGAK